MNLPDLIARVEKANEIERRIQNAAYELAIAESEAAQIGLPVRLLAQIATVVFKTSSVGSKVRRHNIALRSRKDR